MLLGKKSSSLEPGYVYVPYTITSQVIAGYDSKNLSRKIKINRIFELGLHIKGNRFSPKKSITSRYSKKVINRKYYQIVEIKKPTL